MPVLRAFCNDKEFNMLKIRFLSGNMLKILAAVAMLADHVGLMFFPSENIFRIIGRLAFPIFAFMIAEGCKYTRNKIKYFSTIFVLAVICQVVYYFAAKSLYMCVLVTFSLSIVALFALENFKRICVAENSSMLLKFLAAGLFAVSIALIYILNLFFEIDYGFWGCMLPVFVGLFHAPRGTEAPFLCKMDNHFISLILLAVGLMPLTLRFGGIQAYSFMALVPLLLYSGKRGKLNLKYFFYVFYPLHLVVLEGIYVIWRM